MANNVIVIDLPTLQKMAQNDAQELRRIRQWIHERARSYSLNVGDTLMTALGLDSGQRSAMLAMIADFSRLDTIMAGTVVGTAADIEFDCDMVLGVY